MRKLIRAIMICTLVMSLMIAQTYTVCAASSVIYVTADRTEAEPGDTVNFTVSLGPVSEMGTMQMVLDIPKGMTYVDGSGKLADGLKSKLGYDYMDFTEKSLMINGMASAADYSAGSETVLCTFSCTVDDGYKGKAEVGLTNLEFLSCEDWTDHTGDYAVSKAVISVGQDAAQGRSADPGKASDPSGSSVSQSQSDNAQAEGQAGDGASEANDSTQGNGTEDQSADEAKTETTGEAAGNAAAERTEEEHSSAAIWLIALAAILLMAVAIAVVFKKRKRQ
jgi:hypothetical protein